MSLFEKARLLLKKKEQKQPETVGEHAVSWIKTLVNAIVVVMIVNGLLIASFVVPTGSMESTVMAGDFVFVNRFIFRPSSPQVIPFINQPMPYFSLPGWRKPEQGDVIVFIFPGNRDEVQSQNFEYYLKRCVAVAGNSLQIINDSIYVNGKYFPLPEHAQFDNAQEMPEEYDKMRTFPPGRGFTRSNYGPIRIPKEGDIVKLTPENYREWETFIRREGHNVGFNGSSILIDGSPASSYTVQRNYVFGIGDNRYNSLDSRYWGFIPEEDVIGTPMVVYWSWKNRDEYDNEGSLAYKLQHIRWSRIATIIR